jgi:uncharacterized LabA/DUF88 family protein
LQSNNLDKNNNMKIAICVDYDNLERAQKESGILQLITKILMGLPDVTGNIADCEIRVYGGWYENQIMTPLAQKVTTNLQSEFPAIIRVNTADNSVCAIKASAQLALSLLEEPNHHLFGTYRRKNKPSNIRVETPENIGCAHQNCPLPYAKKLLQTGKCNTIGCSTVSDSLVYRHEQKIVDTMLTCDLLYLGQRGFDQILIVSSDDDFLPAIRSAILRGAKLIRVHPKASQNREEVRVAGSRLIEMGF